MKTIGLTGGIATGKSTVAHMLVELGAHVIDADDIAHQIILPGQPAYIELIQEFGKKILGKNQHVDRGILGEIVFHDEKKRRRLNEITHPRIGIRIMEWVRQKQEAGTAVAVIEAALLIENRGAGAFRPLVVVTTDPETQIRRLMIRDNTPRKAALARIKTQMPVEEKAKLADFVIDNSGALESTYGQTRDVWAKIHAKTHV